MKGAKAFFLVRDTGFLLCLVEALTSLLWSTGVPWWCRKLSPLCARAMAACPCNSPFQSSVWLVPCMAELALWCSWTKMPLCTAHLPAGGWNSEGAGEITKSQTGFNAVVISPVGMGHFGNKPVLASCWNLWVVDFRAVSSNLRCLTLRCLK